MKLLSLEKIQDIVSSRSEEKLRYDLNQINDRINDLFKGIGKDKPQNNVEPSKFSQEKGETIVNDSDDKFNFEKIKKNIYSSVLMRNIKEILYFAYF